MKCFKTQAVCLFFSFVSIVLLATSCGSPAKQADLLVTPDGKPAGVVVKYGTAIDKTTVNTGSYLIPGQTISKVFVSDVNPFSKDPGNKELKGKGGRYAVILLKQGAGAGKVSSKDVDLVNPSNPGLDVRVKQVSTIKTISGKQIKPWGKALKTTDAYITEASR